MIKFIFTIFFLWLLYKVIFDFIIPVYNSTRQVRQQMNTMQQRMREQYQQQHQQQQNTQQQQQQHANQSARPDKGDYIDFEEVK
ncbi:DUF4834 family protein [Chitinophaga pendula]|uniref:DUF4834 family protein n=1 Tax=Chitinophaga TaxID=79328 RepID=UPI000BAFECCC|nr:MULTISPECIES: DUF4834 family protein [Chitinophaga]ASZ10273.1 hypothetical protein CK934_04395 [Chitinophaga sp. MD30]UCJ06767.1 DUF4834 family protein [Chitinophaga pendula]